MSDLDVQKQERHNKYHEGAMQCKEVDPDFKDISKFDDQMFLRLDLASGNKPRQGFKSVDISTNNRPDYIVDLTKFPWPFEDNSVFEISCSHYVEHCKDLISFMNECYRILKPLSQITISAPYYTSVKAISDPTHVRQISEGSFNYFSDAWRKTAGIDDLQYYGISCNYEILNICMVSTDEWKFRADEAKTWASKHYFNVVDEICVIMRSLKNIERYK